MGNDPIIYDIVVSQKAQYCLESKYAYIVNELHGPAIAYNWLTRLKREIHENLTTFPSKYREFDASGRRIFISRTDIVLYRVDEEHRAVIIESVYTRGKDLTSLTQ